MDIRTAVSTLPDTAAAVEQALAHAHAPQHPPSLVVVVSTRAHDPHVIQRALAQHLPGVPFSLGTSCQGLLTQDGVYLGDHVLGLFVLSDPQGSYGAGSGAFEAGAEAGAAEAVERAMARTDRPGQQPDLVWLTGSPGTEESVLASLEGVLGPNVPQIGGSCADDDVSGAWWCGGPDWAGESGVGVAVMFPSGPVGMNFHSGYAPTGARATVTSAEGRTVQTLDGRPAAHVYEEWTGALGPAAQHGGGVLMSTTLAPLGMEVGAVGSTPSYLLLHPAEVAADGSMTLFANVQAGDSLVLMQGTVDSLVSRAGRVARGACEVLDGARPAGALVVYCAGCMLTVREEMEQVRRELAQALQGAPFLTTFTFGEQGRFLGGQNRHGNLMISVVAFGEAD